MCDTDTLLGQKSRHEFVHAVSAEHCPSFGKEFAKGVYFCLPHILGGVLLVVLEVANILHIDLDIVVFL